MNEGASPLFIAAENGHHDTVALLLDRGADIRQAVSNGMNPLHAAADEGQTAALRLLLHFLDTHPLSTPAHLWLDKQGNTPLHYAAKKQQLDCVRALLTHGAIVTTRNEQGQTPLVIAAEAHDAQLFGILLAAWFKQRSPTLARTLSHQAEKEQKHTDEREHHGSGYYSYWEVRSPMVLSFTLPTTSKDWPSLPPAPLLLAKASRRRLPLHNLSQQAWQESADYLGKGAFGKVWKVALPQVTVALKAIQMPELQAWFKIDAAHAVDILQWEINQLEKVQYPHIVELLGVDTTATPLFAMECCDTTLDKQPPVSSYEQWRIAWEVAASLAYLHELSLVHRDIKPENILLKAGLAKLADMGLARVDPLLLDTPEPEQLEGLIGDTAWASPEEKAAFLAYRQGKIKGVEALEFIKSKATPAADIYRYGLVLKTITHTESLSAIAEACLHPESSTRPQALQILAALENHILHPHPVLAKLAQRLGILAHHQEHALAHALPVWVSQSVTIDWLEWQEGVDWQESDKKEQPLPFAKIWETFLHSDKPTLDIRGAGGLGKTLLGYDVLRKQWLALRAWLMSPMNTPPPTLLLALTPAALAPTQQAWTVEERLATVYHLTTAECDALKAYPVVFWLDGIDEWAAQPHWDLQAWPHAKTWRIGRPLSEDKDAIGYYYLLPFNQCQIAEYLTQTLQWAEPIAERFLSRLPFSRVREVLRNPFVLAMFALLWPSLEQDRWEDLTQNDIFQRYFGEWLNQQTSHWLTGSYKTMFSALLTQLQGTHATLTESFRAFSGEVCQALFTAKRLEGVLILDNPWAQIDERLTLLASTAYAEKVAALAKEGQRTRLQAHHYIAFAKAHLARIDLPAPLQIHNHYYRFMHKSLYAYTWCQALLTANSLPSLIPSRSLEEDEEVLDTFASLYQQFPNPSLKEATFMLVDSTREYPERARQAGNALTLLNWARLTLTHDYRGTAITAANLAYGNLSHSHFQEAQWDAIYLPHAALNGAEVEEKQYADFIKDEEPGRPHPPLLGHLKPIVLTATSSHGQWAATADETGVILLWEVATSKRLRQLDTHVTPTALAIHHTMAILLGDKEGKVYFWSAQGELVRKIQIGFNAILGVQFVGNEQIWVCNNENQNYFYTLDGWQCSRQWQENIGTLTCSRGNAALTRQAAGTETGSLNLLDSTELPIKKMMYQRVHRGAVRCLAFSSDGQRLASGGEEGEVSVRSAIDGKAETTLYYQSPITHVVWSVDGTWLLASTEQTIHAWHRERGTRWQLSVHAPLQGMGLAGHRGWFADITGSFYGFDMAPNGSATLTWREMGAGHVLDLTDTRRIVDDALPDDIAPQRSGQGAASPLPAASLRAQTRHLFLAPPPLQQRSLQELPRDAEPQAYPAPSCCTLL